MLWLPSFQGRSTKLERFLPKNQHAQRKLLNFENGVGRFQKGRTFDFQSQFSMSKIIRIFLNFFSLKNTYQFRSTFLLLTFLDNINF